MCGIFGIINTKYEKINKNIVNVLGINNDSRGGDSCGLFIDKKIEYGYDTTAYWSNFFTKSTLLKNTSHCNILLGHCRKASVGGVKKEYAQPVVIYKKGKIEFVLIHNGTIHNYKDLAKKYIPNIDISNMTDSQVMANIFYNAGYDCLSEYLGGGVFVTVDYRTKTPSVKVFQGKSKKTYYTNNEELERPFYFGKIGDSIIFSSILDYLRVYCDYNKVYTVKPNTLLEFKYGKTYVIAEYSRANVNQTSYNGKTSNSNSYSAYTPSLYTGIDDDDDDWEYAGYSISSSKSSSLLSSPCIYFNSNEMLYYIKGKAAHGTFMVDKFGAIYTNDTNRKDLKKISFWQGILLNNDKCFSFLKEVCKTSYDCKPEELDLYDPGLIFILSPLPHLNTDDKLFYEMKDLFTAELVNKQCTFPLSSAAITFQQGRKLMIKYEDYRISFDAYNEIECDEELNTLTYFYAN